MIGFIYQAEHKVSQQEIISGNSSQGLKDVVFDLASLANAHLEHVR